MPDALKKADEVLQQAVQGITDLINVPGLINLDFADVQTVMTDKGIAHIGIGSGRGDDKALEAVKQAVASPLLETTIAGASHVIINVSGDITLMDASDAAEYVQELAGEEASIIFGAMYDDSRADEATITVIATGLHNVEGSASKLKSRLENPRMASAGRTTTHTASHTASHAQSFERPRAAAAAPQSSSSRLDLGMAPTKNGGTAGVKRPAGGTVPTLETPKTPTSKVKEQSIKIPDFFKKLIDITSYVRRTFIVRLILSFSYYFRFNFQIQNLKILSNERCSCRKKCGILLHRLTNSLCPNPYNRTCLWNRTAPGKERR